MSIHLKLRHRIRTRPGDTLYVHDVCQVIADDPSLEQKLENLPLYHLKPHEGNIVIIDVMHVLRVIQQYDPGLEINIHGAAQSIVEVVYNKRKPAWVLLIFVWAILFVGSGLALMNFHEDVSMREVHQKLYYLITGDKNDYPLVIQIPYSIGIGLGMILFFNHLFRKRINDEPSPLEVEMFNYQQSLDQYVIHNENRESRRDKDDDV